MNDMTNPANPNNIYTSPTWGAACLPGNVWTPSLCGANQPAQFASAPASASSGGAFAAYEPAARSDAHPVAWLAGSVVLLLLTILLIIVVERRRASK